VLDRAVVQRLTDAGQPFSGGHAKTEREPEAGICIAVKGNDLPALARKASGENGGDVIAQVGYGQDLAARLGHE